MSMTDPIADMLTRIRNACGAKHRRVDMPVSKLKVEIAKILKENNFIQDYKTLDTEDGRQTLRVVLKYAQGGQPVIRELRRVSTRLEESVLVGAGEREIGREIIHRWSGWRSRRSRGGGLLAERC